MLGVLRRDKRRNSLDKKVENINNLMVITKNLKLEVEAGPSVLRGSCYTQQVETCSQLSAQSSDLGPLEYSLPHVHIHMLSRMNPSMHAMLNILNNS